MSEFSDRAEEHLDRIAASVTPSPNAWSEFQHRIATQDNQPETELIMLDKNRTPKTNNKAWAMVAAAAAFVVIGGLAVVLGDDPTTISNDPDPATTTIAEPTPTTDMAESERGFFEKAADVKAAEKIGLEFLDARNEHDGARLLSLLAEDVLIAGADFAQTKDEYLLQADWERAVGWQFIDPTCGASVPDRVVCNYSIRDSVTEALGLGPYSGNSFLIEISEGQIVGVTHNFNANQLLADGVVFGAWVDENYPGDLQRMMDPNNSGGNAPALLTPESIALWESHTAEYIATLQ